MLRDDVLLVARISGVEGTSGVGRSSCDGGINPNRSRACLARSAASLISRLMRLATDRAFLTDCACAGVSGGRVGSSARPTTAPTSTAGGRGATSFVRTGDRTGLLINCCGMDVGNMVRWGSIDSGWTNCWSTRPLLGRADWRTAARGC